jgi:hypothetical protein
VVSLVVVAVWPNLLANQDVNLDKNIIAFG